MRILVTGHTGFKGAWLSLMLKTRGHEVVGISLEPEANSLYLNAGIKRSLTEDINLDIRDSEALKSEVIRLKPEFVIHMAAQSLVRRSYENPIETFTTNVNGTLNVLSACQQLSHLNGVLVVTTDKVYANVGKVSGYIESDPLGGSDPYSASKSMADIATQSWITSVKNSPIAIARAGNVIGGGDMCADRLIPDLINSYAIGLTPKLRAPNSIRPWQHVLDCLNGYLTLIEKVLDGTAGGAWNFGPNESQSKSVADVADIAGDLWGAETRWEIDKGIHPPEASLLLLNSNKARTKLGWSEKLSFEESIKWTIDWYKNVHFGKEPFNEMLRQIQEFESR
jgi:CDP-glucose 4,6-dehydratase